MQLQGLGLRVAEPRRHVLDRETGILQQTLCVQHARRAQELPWRRQPHPREPALAGAPVDPRPRGDLTDRLDLAGRAQGFLEHPAQLAGKWRQGVRKLVQEVPRR